MRREQTIVRKARIMNILAQTTDPRLCLPKNFGRHIKKNGQLFLERLIEFQGWKKIRIGVLKRNGRIITAGTPTRLNICRITRGEVWIILNIKTKKGNMVDLIHSTQDLERKSFRKKQFSLKTQTTNQIIQAWAEREEEKEEIRQEKIRQEIIQEERKEGALVLRKKYAKRNKEIRHMEKQRQLAEMSNL